MNGLRKFGLVVSLLLYFPLLVVFPLVASFNRTIAHPAFVKQNLRQAGIYNTLGDYLTKQVQKNPDVTTAPIVTQSIAQVLAPDNLQKVVEPTIDNLYTWLANPQGQPPLSIAVEPLKKSLNDTLGANLQQHLAGLPTCTRSHPATTTDPLSLNCLPAGTSPQTLVAQAQQQIATENILPQSSNVNLNGSTQKPDSKISSPVGSQSLDQVAMIYRITRASEPYLIGILALCTIGIVALSRPWAKGLKSLAKFLIPAGLLLIVGVLGLGFILDKFIGNGTDQAPTIATAFEQAIKLTIQAGLHYIRLFSYGYLVSGVVLLIAGIVLCKVLYKKDAPKPEKIEQENMLPDDKNLDDAPVPAPKEDTPAEPPTAKPQTKIEIK